MIEPYYEEPNIKIYCGDCLKIMKDMPDNSIDLVLTDPPYKVKGNYIVWFELIAVEFKKVMKDNATLYVFNSWQNIAEIKVLLDKYFKILNWITWGRSAPGLGIRKSFKNYKEEILLYVNGEDFYFKEPRTLLKNVLPYKIGGRPKGWFYNQDGIRCRWKPVGNLWFYTRPFWAMKEKVAHGQQKPLALIKRIIETSSKEGDLILDPFLGSGTTLIACKELNRKGIGIEISKEYCDMAIQRLKNTTSNLL